MVTRRTSLAAAVTHRSPPDGKQYGWRGPTLRQTSALVTEWSR